MISVLLSRPEVWHVCYLCLFKENHHRRVFTKNKAIDQSFVAYLNVSATTCSINNFLANLGLFEDQNAIFDTFWVRANFIIKTVNSHFVGDERIG